MNENELSTIIIGCALDIHKELGPGLLENAYHQCLLYKLRKEGLKVESEKPMPIVYEEVKLDCGYRIDLLVEDKVVVEIKSVDEINNIHSSNTYLRENGRLQAGFTH